jgi:hypothetical protein
MKQYSGKKVEVTEIRKPHVEGLKVSSCLLDFDELENMEEDE